MGERSDSVPWPVWAIVTLATAVITAVAIVKAGPDEKSPKAAVPQRIPASERQMTYDQAISRSAVAACAFEHGLRSLPSEQPEELEVANRWNFPVSLIWIDTEGKRRFYSRLEPGDHVRQSTYSQHYWLIADLDGRCLELRTVP